MSGLQKNERDVYVILAQFLSGAMDPLVFEKEFYIAFCLEESVNVLSEAEEEILNELSSVVEWFSPFEDERERNGSVDAQAMREAALLAQEKLNQLKQKNEIL